MVSTGPGVSRSSRSRTNFKTSLARDSVTSVGNLSRTTGSPSSVDVPGAGLRGAADEGGRGAGRSPAEPLLFPSLYSCYLFMFAHCNVYVCLYYHLCCLSLLSCFINMFCRVQTLYWDCMLLCVICGVCPCFSMFLFDACRCCCCCFFVIYLSCFCCIVLLMCLLVICFILFVCGVLCLCIYCYLLLLFMLVVF